MLPKVRMSMAPGRAVGRAVDEAGEAVEVAVVMFMAQYKESVFENPGGSPCSKHPCLERLASLPGMREVKFEMTVATRVYTNSEAIDGMLELRSKGGQMRSSEVIDIYLEGLG